MHIYIVALISSVVLLFLVGRVISTHFNFLVGKRLFTAFILSSLILLLSLNTPHILLLMFLIFCLSGDIFNSMKEDSNDVMILSGTMFLIAHILLIFYMSLSIKFSLYGFFIIFVTVVPLNIHLLYKYSQLKEATKTNLVLISTYVLIITVTVLFSIMNFFNNTHHLLFNIGILLFYVSDIFLLLFTIIFKKSYAHILVWSTYIPGMWLIVLDFVLKGKII